MTVWITRRPDPEVAAELETNRGPLAGVRLAVKDNIDAAGLPTTAACPAFACMPDADAAAVRGLLDGRRGRASARPTSTSSPPASSAPARRTARCPTAAGPNSSAADPAPDRRSRWPPAKPTSRSAPTPPARAACPPACRASSGIKPTLGVISTDGVVPACESYDCVTIFAQNAGPREPRHGSDGCVRK